MWQHVLIGALSGMCRLVGSIGLMPLTFLIPPALWIKVRSKRCKSFCPHG